jgi:protein required for attachment to host cells
MSAQVWVATFDGSLARVWSADERGRLHERPDDGLDGRANAEAKAGRGQGQPQVPNAGYVEAWDEPRFVEHFTRRLAERADQGAFDRLIVAADPHALGYFRECAPEPLRKKVVVEVSKDYVHTPVKDLEAALAEHLPQA